MAKPGLFVPAVLPKATLGTGGGDLTCLALEPHGKMLARGHRGGKIELHGMNPAQRLATFKAPTGVRALAFSPDGRSLYSGGGGNRRRGSPSNEVIRWDVASQKEAGRYDWPGGLLNTLALSPDGKWLAAGGEERAQVWDAATGKEYPVPAGINRVNCLAFSADSATLAAAGADGPIRLWETATGARKGQLLGHTSAVKALCFHPDGRALASGSLDHTLRLWDLRTQEMTHRLSDRHNSWVRTLACSAGGTVLAIGLNNRQTLLVNNPRADWQQEAAPLAALVPDPRLAKDPGGIVALTPDGTLLATADREGPVRVWELPPQPGAPMVPVPKPNPAPPAKEDAAEKDAQRLQGAWERVAIVHGANRYGPNPDDTLTFRGNQFEVKEQGKVTLAGTFEIIDAAAAPKQMDLVCTEGRHKGKRLRAVYRIDGDRLETCTDSGDDQRPKVLSGAAGFYRELRRKNP